MQAWLNASTDVAVFTLYDPAAIPADLLSPRPLDWLDQQAAEGNLIGYSYGGDGSADILLLLDEQIPERFMERRIERHSIERGYLNVPSGNLEFTGMEYLRPWNRDGPKPELVDPRMGTMCEIPPGHYQVVAFEIDWGGAREEQVVIRSTPRDRMIDQTFGFLIAIVFLATIFIFPIIFVVTWIVDSFSTAMWFLLCVAIFEVIFWLIVGLVPGLAKATDRMQEIYQAVHREYPPIIVQLTPVESPPQGFQPGLLSECAVDPADH